MAWFKSDDQLHSHPKARKAQLEAMGLWAVAGPYSSGYKLDGFVPVHYVTSWPKGKALAGRLVTAGLWHVNEPGLGCSCIPEDADLTEPGWRFHDFLDYNPTADEVERERKAARIRQQRLRERRRSRVNGEEL